MNANLIMLCLLDLAEEAEHRKRLSPKDAPFLREAAEKILEYKAHAEKLFFAVTDREIDIDDPYAADRIGYYVAEERVERPWVKREFEKAKGETK